MKRIGIVIYDYVLGYSALAINTALALEHAGYDVHVFVDTATYERGKIAFGDKRITVHPIDVQGRGKSNPLLSNRWQTFPRSWITASALRILHMPQSPLREICVRPIAFFQRLFLERGTIDEQLHRQTATFLPGLPEFSKKLSSSIMEGDFTCLLGFGLNGLIAATTVALQCTPERRPPVVYYSTELLPDTTTYSPTISALSSLERICSQLCSFVVIQDEARGAHFTQATGVPKEKLVYLPVSGLRPAYREQGNYFRELFNISSEKRILLHAGALLRETMCLEIAQEALTWKEDLVLILHSPASVLSSEWVDPSYLDKLKGVADNDRVYLSLDPVAWEDVPEMMSSADIGLMFYDLTDPNFYEIARSSNKLVQYLQVGLPIIAIDFPSLKEVMQECRCGETTNHPSAIETAARNILSNYGTYRTNAFACYEGRYNFARYFERVLEKISEIA